MENWNKNTVSKEVFYAAQKRVFTEKYIDWKRNIKAKLVVRGLEKGI